jgi:N-acetylneuraminate synthase/N,N'-diacetyllegionaminate synthase
MPLGQAVSIAGRKLGGDEPALVVAEAGVNHDGDLCAALELVDAAAAAGADAIKFQTFVAQALATREAPLADYQRQRSGSTDGQRAMLERLCLSTEQLATVAARCERRDILFLSSPFDLASATVLERLGAPALKIASGELTNLPFLGALARRATPLILSTGMATLSEVSEAVRVVGEAGAPLVLLHCVSSYPTPLEQANVRAIDVLRSAFGVPVGYSDHCLGFDASLAAVARGACLLERHLTLDRTRVGPDHAMSLQPDELAELVRRVRAIEAALGDGRKVPQPAELQMRMYARRSIVAARRLEPGETLTADALAIKRPGDGLAPARLAELIGARVARAIEQDEQLTEAHLELLT